MKFIQAQTEPLEVRRQRWPQMVTFADIADPLSVQLVDPDDLAATFGTGFALRKVTVQVTDEPVTLGRVEPVLSWLGDIVPNLLDGNTIHTIRATNRLANSLSPYNFSTEISEQLFRPLTISRKSPQCAFPWGK